jgi:hypothetical protein
MGEHVAGKMLFSNKALCAPTDSACVPIGCIVLLHYVPIDMHNNRISFQAISPQSWLIPRDVWLFSQIMLIIWLVIGTGFNSSHSLISPTVCVSVKYREWRFIVSKVTARLEEGEVYYIYHF